MDCEFIETQKGGRALLSGGYRYLRIRKGNEGREFWRCCLRTCVAKATTVEDKLEAVRGEHNHAPNSAKNKAEKVVLHRGRRSIDNWNKGLSGSRRKCQRDKCQ